MRILYIFPHPDDESFGPAPVIWQQKKRGHQVFLLTLTKGEATKQRNRLGLSKQEMGDVRFNEMRCVEKVLDLDGMTVLDFPDSKLHLLDPKDLEDAIISHIQQIGPDILVTYPVTGNSGFTDHLVTHAIVKQVFCRRADLGLASVKRLALYGLLEEQTERAGEIPLKALPEPEVDAVVHLDDDDLNKFQQALDCYETYLEVIKRSNVKEVHGRKVAFTFFGEHFDQVLDDITLQLPQTGSSPEK